MLVRYGIGDWGRRPPHPPGHRPPPPPFHDGHRPPPPFRDGHRPPPPPPHPNHDGGHRHPLGEGWGRRTGGHW